MGQPSPFLGAEMKTKLAIKIWLIFIGGVSVGTIAAFDSWWWLVPAILTGILMFWICETYEGKNGKE